MVAAYLRNRVHDPWHDTLTRIRMEAGRGAACENQLREVMGLGPVSGVD